MNGRTYAKLSQKYIHGTLEAPLLLWGEISASLYDMGFCPNPYNWCVIKIIINGKQCNILFHVDNLKVSYVYPDVVLCKLS